MTGKSTFCKCWGHFILSYASCRHCHSAVEAALSLRRAEQLTPEEIAEIHVTTYDLAVYGHDHTEIQGTGSAKMSIPYSVAAALVMNEAGLSTVTGEAVGDPVILDLAKKVTVSEDPEYSRLAPGKRIAALELRTRDGRSLRRKVEYPKGEPENPLSREELREKYLQLMDYAGQDRTYSEQLYGFARDGAFCRLAQVLKAQPCRQRG